MYTYIHRLMSFGSPHTYIYIYIYCYNGGSSSSSSSTTTTNNNNKHTSNTNDDNNDNDDTTPAYNASGQWRSGGPRAHRHRVRPLALQAGCAYFIGWSNNNFNLTQT